MKTPVAGCENTRCEKLIHKGDKSGGKGFKVYCSGNCLSQSFGYVKQTILGEKHIVGGAR